ncbi:hypothetical protein [Holospora undulata]|uniref:hypothetical protein n=1 Tax=Holospora undulata TaxID=1169117 RepID=UPI0003304809|nr:hypothetical protein [Holospora undulata]
MRTQDVNPSVLTEPDIAKTYRRIRKKLFFLCKKKFQSGIRKKNKDKDHAAVALSSVNFLLLPLFLKLLDEKLKTEKSIT